MRKTETLKKVLGFSLDCYPNGFYGTELIKQRTIFAGTVYPLLQRLEKRGYLTSKWEEIDPAVAGRPRRHRYELTYKGFLLAKEMGTSNDENRAERGDTESPEANPI